MSPQFLFYNNTERINKNKHRLQQNSNKQLLMQKCIHRNFKFNLCTLDRIKEKLNNKKKKITA